VVEFIAIVRALEREPSEMFESLVRAVGEQGAARKRPRRG
jgi:hypothetical protein